MSSKTSKLSESTKARRDLKAMLMKLILDRKSELFEKFGAPSSTNTHDNQVAKWEEVRKLAIENGYSALDEKTADDLRYKVFSKFKTQTIAKLDKLKKTGAGGNKLNEVCMNM